MSDNDDTLTVLLYIRCDDRGRNILIAKPRSTQGFEVQEEMTSTFWYNFPEGGYMHCKGLMMKHRGTEFLLSPTSTLGALAGERTSLEITAHMVDLKDEPFVSFLDIQETIMMHPECMRARFRASRSSGPATRANAPHATPSQAVAQPQAGPDVGAQDRRPPDAQDSQATPPQGTNSQAPSPLSNDNSRLALDERLEHRLHQSYWARDPRIPPMRAIEAAQRDTQGALTAHKEAASPPRGQTPETVQQSPPQSSAVVGLGSGRTPAARSPNLPPRHPSTLKSLTAHRYRTRGAKALPLMLLSNQSSDPAGNNPDSAQVPAGEGDASHGDTQDLSAELDNEGLQSPARTAERATDVEESELPETGPAETQMTQQVSLADMLTQPVESEYLATQLLHPIETTPAELPASGLPAGKVGAPRKRKTRKRNRKAKELPADTVDAEETADAVAEQVLVSNNAETRDQEPLQQQPNEERNEGGASPEPSEPVRNFNVLEDSDEDFVQPKPAKPMEQPVAQRLQQEATEQQAPPATTGTKKKKKKRKRKVSNGDGLPPKDSLVAECNVANEEAVPRKKRKKNPQYVQPSPAAESMQQDQPAAESVQQDQRKEAEVEATLSEPSAPEQDEANTSEHADPPPPQEEACTEAAAAHSKKEMQEKVAAMQVIPSSSQEVSGAQNAQTRQREPPAEKSTALTAAQAPASPTNKGMDAIQGTLARIAMKSPSLMASEEAGKNVGSLLNRWCISSSAPLGGRPRPSPQSDARTQPKRRNFDPYYFESESD